MRLADFVNNHDYSQYFQYKSDLEEILIFSIHNNSRPSESLFQSKAQFELDVTAQN